MKTSTIIIIYWLVVFIPAIGVYLQKDESAHRNALSWIGLGIFVFCAGLLINWFRNKKGIQ